MDVSQSKSWLFTLSSSVGAFLHLGGQPHLYYTESKTSIVLHMLAAIAI